MTNSKRIIVTAFLAFASYVCVFALTVNSLRVQALQNPSGHRVLIKRAPGNRGPSERGTTHEATSGMSS